MEWTTDRRLQTRIVGALVLTLAGYVALFGPVFWFLPLSTALAVCAVFGAIVAVLVTQADRLVYLVAKPVAIGREDHPDLYDTVDRLAARADVPRPPIAVVPSDVPNALSAGTGDRTVVCVTLGLLRELDDDEREAVLAHEIAHLKNGDSSVMTVAAFPTTVSLAVWRAATRHVNGWAIVFGFVWVFLYAALVSVPVLLVSLPGTLVLSRYREYAADRGAVALTGHPTALATALGKLHGAERTPDADLRRVASFNAFCIVPTGSLPTGWTHPPTHERIRRLRTLAADLEGS